MSLLQDLRTDLAYSLRQLRRTPAFTAMAIATLALVIGGTAAIFSIVNSLIVRTLPVAEPHRLVIVSSISAQRRDDTAGWTYLTWEHIRQNAAAFDGAIAWSGAGPPQRFDLSSGGETQLVDGLFVSGDFFTTLGVGPALGRVFTPADDVRGGGPGGPVAVISHRLWQRRFAGAPDVVGRALVIERVPFTIVGVTPPEFFGAEIGRSFDVALPVGAEPLLHREFSLLEPVGPPFLTVMLRLKAGQSMEAATNDMRTLQPQLGACCAPGYEREFLKDPLTLEPAAGGASPLRTRYARPLMTVLVIAGLVLLIACANLANLMLARVAGRRYELSTRIALGAPRWRLLRQLAIESLILAATGAVLGLGVAAWGSQALLAELATAQAGIFLDLSLDWRVLAFTAAMTVLTTLLFGIAPALPGTRVAAMTALKEHAHGAGGDRHSGLSGGLVVCQIALSLLLIVGAGLFIRTFDRLASVPLGFESERVVTIDVNASRSAVDPSRRTELYQRLADVVSRVPGVANASASPVTPFIERPMMQVPMRVPGESEEGEPVALHYVTPAWFATYGTAIREGRDIGAGDTRTAAPVIVVSKAFVRRFFPDGQAVGHSVVSAMQRPGEAPVPKTIVGVVDDAVLQSIAEEVHPTMYQPLAQWDWGPPPAEIMLSAQSEAGSPALLTRAIAAALTGVDRNLAFSFRMLEDQVNASLTRERLVAVLAVFYGGLALFLAALGLYGITSYMVNARRSEIGVRMALGADRSGVVGLIVARVAWLVALGGVIGAGASAGLSQFVTRMLYGVTPRDPFVYAAAALTLALVATLAAWLPAYRAARADPWTVLREN
jgi:putative ABC transport system permease protein